MNVYFNMLLHIKSIWKYSWSLGLCYLEYWPLSPTYFNTTCILWCNAKVTKGLVNCYYNKKFIPGRGSVICMWIAWVVSVFWTFYQLKTYFWGTKNLATFMFLQKNLFNKYYILTSECKGYILTSVCNSGFKKSLQSLIIRMSEFNTLL
jgi:hypothetical protein